ncbi:hypothetical protein BJY59DRAFT_718264 [Rhodotorula toruloides]
MWRMVADWVLHPVLLGWLCVYLILRDPELERLWRLKDHVVESLLGGHERFWTPNQHGASSGSTGNEITSTDMSTASSRPSKTSRQPLFPTVAGSKTSSPESTSGTTPKGSADNAKQPCTTPSSPPSSFTMDSGAGPSSYATPTAHSGASAATTHSI